MNLRLAILSVHTCPLAPLGGWETGGLNVYVREVSRELAARGVQVDVFTRRQVDHTADIVELSPGVRVVHVEAGPPRNFDKYEVVDYLSEFACGVQRYRLLTGRRYDLIHAHYWLSMRTGLHFQARWQAPLVAQFHTLAQLKNRVARDDAEREHQVRFDVERAVIDQADRVVAVSATDRRQMETLYGACPRKIAVVPGGVDLHRFRPGPRDAARAALGLSREAEVLLFVGRIQRLKGIEVVLRAAAELRARRPARELVVLVVGGRPVGSRRGGPEQRELARLQTLAARLGLGDVVRFVGAVQQSDLPTYYQAADATVMPSAYESFGLVAVESMACGTPVVASQVGGLRSIVDDGRNGFLIPWRHPNLFADKLEQILADPGLADRLGRSGARGMQRFSWGAAADRLLALYQELVAADRPDSAREQVLAGRRPQTS